jgi:hypothetical protein
MQRRTALVFLASMMSALWALNAQIATDGDHEPAANAWMKIPTPYTAHDGSVPTDLRAARDQFWDSVFPSHEPLTPETAGATAVGYTSAGGSHEIDQLSSRAVVIATFTNARSILTASGHCVYTEVVLRVNEVFESTNPPIALSTDITVSFVGGTVNPVDPNNPQPYSIQWMIAEPIVVDDKGVIICGHTRLLAAQKLGLKEAPVHVAENLTPTQVRAYRLLDNRSHEETT